MKVVNGLIALIILGLIVGLPTGAFAQATDPLYFEETGHSIKGEFLKFYLSAGDSLLLFGYPVTDEFVDPINGQRSQYFQRARFDLVDTPAGQRIQLAPLGEILYQTGAPEVPLTKSSPVCRSFSQTKHTVCYAFLQFYDLNNGSVYFGNPVSELEEEDNRYVQYFENVRMEWRPELPSGQRVALSDLGRIYYDYRIGLQDLTRPQGTNISNLPRTIQANAFVNYALIPANSDQDLYVIVQDQTLQPVEGASVSVTILQPDGQQELFRAPFTNYDGISKLTFKVKDLPVREVVEVEVTVEYQAQISETSTWFRIWW